MLAFLWPCLHKLEFLLLVPGGGGRGAMWAEGNVGFLDRGLLSAGQVLSDFLHIYLLPPAQTSTASWLGKDLSYNTRLSPWSVAWHPQCNGYGNSASPLASWFSGKGYPATTEPYGNMLRLIQGSPALLFSVLHSSVSLKESLNCTIPGALNTVED